MSLSQTAMLVIADRQCVTTKELYQALVEQEPDNKAVVVEFINTLVKDTDNYEVRKDEDSEFATISIRPH